MPHLLHFLPLQTLSELIIAVQAMLAEGTTTINSLNVSIGTLQIILPDGFSDSLFGSSSSSTFTNFAPPNSPSSSSTDSSFRSVSVPSGVSGGSIDIVGPSGNVSSVLTSPDVVEVSASSPSLPASPNTLFSSNFAHAIRFFEVVAPISGILQVSFQATTSASSSDINSNAAFAEAILSIDSNGGFQEQTRGVELGPFPFGGIFPGADIFGFPIAPFATAANDSVSPPVVNGLGEAAFLSDTFTLTLSQNVIADDIVFVKEALASTNAVDVGVIPLPTTLMLFSSALLGLAGISRRKTI